MRRAPFVTASAAILWILLAAACGSSSSSPVTSPSAGAPTALKIIGAANSRIVVGDTAQFTAMATLINGTTANVTNDAGWTASDATIFAVAPGGKVTALKEGSADIRATYRGVSDKDYTTAQPFLTFVAYGTVTAAPPDFGGVSGVRVDIAPAPSGTMTTTTDSAGDYSFPPLKGGIYTITVSRDGFHGQTRSITATRDIRTDFPIVPVPPAGATARCKDRSWSYATSRAAACAANSGVSYWACPGPFCGS
jgi:carboxypeptidase family protein